MDDDSSVNKLKVMLVMIIIFGGFSVAFTTNPLFKIHPWFRFLGIGLMLLGILYLYSYYQAVRDARIAKEKELDKKRKRIIKGRRIYTETTADETEDQGIALKIMERLSDASSKLSDYTFPVVGAIIIDAVIIYNLFTGQGLNFESWDTITIMLGASLILYNFIPAEFSVTRDFVVFFLGILFIILVFPQLIYGLLVGAKSSAYYTKVLLADPVVALLNAFGIDSSSAVEYRTGGTYTAVITYELVDGGTDKVGITEACSGIYTTSIFISAFITYVLVEYKEIDIKVAVILGLGILTSYIANILRMTIITGVGHYYGTEALLTAHQNAGWLIFLAWIIPFWYLVFRFLIKDDDDDKERYAVLT